MGEKGRSFYEWTMGGKTRYSSGIPQTVRRRATGKQKAQRRDGGICCKEDAEGGEWGSVMWETTGV